MTAVRIAGALGWFWLSGVPWEEGRALLAATLAAADAEGVPDAERPLADRVALGTLFYPSVGLTYFAGDTDAMLALTTRELALWDTVDADVAAGDAAGRPVPPALRLAAARGRTLAHQLRGLAHAMRGEQAEAVRQLDRSLAVADAAGDAWLLAVMTMRRALVHLTVGNHAAADADYRAAIPRLRAVGERWFLSLTHEGMGANALATGDLATAAAEARQAVRALREERDEWFASRGLDTLAAVLAAASTAGGDPAGTDPGVARLGARLLGLTDALRRRCGAAVLGTDQQRQADAATALRTRLGDAAFAAAHAEGEALTLDDAFAIVDDDQAFTGLVAGPAAAGGVASRTAGDDLRPAAPVAPRPAPRIEHTLRLDVLGPLVMAHDGTPVPTGVLPAGKATELLLLLVARPAGVTRDQAGLALWPEASLAQVRNAFHVTLHHVRRALGGLGDADGDGGAAPWVVFADGRYRLLREAGPGRVLDCDLDAVVAAADVLRRAERAREPLAAAALADLAGALARGTRGTFGEGAAAGEWMAEVEDRARAAWADGTQLLARQHARAGRQAEAASMLEAFVGREPLREAAHRELMVLWTAVGERARALAHYDTLTAVLRRELNAEPARETRTLAEQIRQAR
jgi:DNA-binding SARP family transcriptional activator